MSDHTARSPDRPGRGRRTALIALVLAAAGVGWAASSQAAIWEALQPDRPGKVAPYRLLMPPTASADREIATLQARIRANPDGFLDLAALGEAYLRRAKATGEASWYLLAEQAAERSLASFSGDNPGAWQVLARVAIARHDFAQARLIAERLQRSHPRDPGVVSALATIHLAQGNLKAAEQAAETLVATAPGLASYTQRGLAREAAGRVDEAAADFVRAIALEQPGQLESSALARAWLGRLHARHGHWVEADDLYREALRIVPEQPVVLGLTADLALQQGRHAEAVRAYARAYARDPSPAFLLGEARAHRADGRSAEAEAVWARAERQLRQDLAAASFGHRRDLARLLLERGRPAEAPEALALMDAELKVRQDAETRELRAQAFARVTGREN